MAERARLFTVVKEESIRKFHVPITNCAKADRYVLLDTNYDGKINKIRMDFYDETKEELFAFYVPFFHFSCLSDLSPEEIDVACINAGRSEGYLTRRVHKFNRLKFVDEEMTQILTLTPTEITSKKRGVGISEILEPVAEQEIDRAQGELDRFIKGRKKRAKPGEIGSREIHAWENHIKSKETFLFDYGYVPGRYYTFRDVTCDVLRCRRCACGGERSHHFYGYLKDDPRQEVRLIRAECSSCGRVTWRDESVSDDGVEQWGTKLLKPNPVDSPETVTMKMPVLVEPDVDPTNTDEVIEKFAKTPPEERALALSLVQDFFAPVPKFKMSSLDIEIFSDDRKNVPNPLKAAHPVAAVVMVDNRGKSIAYVLKYYAVTIPGNIRTEEGKRKYLQRLGITNFDPANLSGDKYTNRGTGNPWEEFPELPHDVEVAETNDERELLEAVFERIKKYPILVTFNGDNFDLPYLYFRAVNLGISPKQIPYRVDNDPREGIKIYTGGLIHLDIYNWFSNMSIKNYAYGGVYPNNDLDTISTKLLGRGKVRNKLRKENGEEKWITEYSRNEVIYYCWTDARLTLDLVSRNMDEMMTLVFIIMRVGRSGFDNVVRHTISKWIYCMIAHYHRANNYLIPRKAELWVKHAMSQSKISGKGFEGALVRDPVPGRHWGVTVADFAGLYPTIIKEYNLSYETLDACKWCSLNLSKAPASICECEHKSRVPGDVQHFLCNTRGIGIFPLLIGTIRDYRVFIFKPRKVKTVKDKSSGKQVPNPKYDPRAGTIEQALKVFVNGSYGVFGSRDFDFYFLPVGETTTAIGRYAAISAAKRAESLGMEVIYGDTDSIFLKKFADDKFATLADWALTDLKCELAIDEKFRFLAMTDRKKNYLGLEVDASKDPVVKGLVGKKKNTPPFFRALFKKAKNYINHAIKKEGDDEKAIPVLIKIARDALARVRAKDIPLTELTYTVQLKQDPIVGYKKSNSEHAKAARMLFERTGTRLTVGDSMSFIKTPRAPVPLQLAVDPKSIDADKYAETLSTALSQLYEAFGISWDDDVLLLKSKENDVRKYFAAAGGKR